MAKKVAVTKPKTPTTSAKVANYAGTEVVGCAHIMRNDKVPPLDKDKFGDRYLGTATRDAFISRFTPQVGFSNTDLEFVAMFEKDKNALSRDFQEIMFYLKDEKTPNKTTDGWMAYDKTKIETTAGTYFILQRKFFDGKFTDVFPADGFRFVNHRSIITKLGRHKDGSLCILVCIADVDGKIIDDHGAGGEPAGVGTKIPPPQ
jgi:hypothetical protein